MPFDPLVANAGRLRILTALAVEERQEFVHLRRRTQLTDGNLAAHGKRLYAAGLIEIEKRFRDGKPVTTYLLTHDGRSALESHARRLISAIGQRRTAAAPADMPAFLQPDEQAAGAEVAASVVVYDADDADDADDWID